MRISHDIIHLCRLYLLPPSRLKKIKCQQPSPETQCDACTLAKIPCRFRDRERYFAERSRSIAGPSATTSFARPTNRPVAQEHFAAGDGSPIEYPSSQHAQVPYGHPQPHSHSQRSSHSPPGTYDTPRPQPYVSPEHAKSSGTQRFLHFRM